VNPEASESGAREALKRRFLAEAGFGGAARERLPMDASTRAYERLRTAAGLSLILMDAPTTAESAPCPPDASLDERQARGWNAMARLAASRVDAFVACAGYLRGRGLSAPQVLALDVEDGLAVVEDLGEGVFARLIEAGADPLPFYETAVDILIDLHAEAPPEALPVGDGTEWPLLTYDAVALQAGADLFPQWWPRLEGGGYGPEALAEWARLWRPVAEAGERGAAVFIHRDYHAENLLWLPGRTGLARVGLIDFQDALKAHPAWDLLSLLQDARREVPAEMEAAMLERYLAARPGIDRDAFLADYAGLAALNAARILGVFARLVARDGKPKYLAFIPRMKRMLTRNLDRPALGPLKAWFEAHAPEVWR
jgi:aminoglycoside/choline kinase family phosphotransferase